MTFLCKNNAFLLKKMKKNMQRDKVILRTIRHFWEGDVFENV